MIQFLVTAQYEAAVVKDINNLRPVLNKFQNAAVYFNLDSRAGKEEQEQIITELLTKSENKDFCVGLVSYDKNEKLAEKYLMDLGASGGYITLDLGFKKSAQILLAVLDATEARGDRKFVRAKVPNGKGSLNFKSGTMKAEGGIIDISIVGMACTFDSFVSKGTYIDSIQLILWGSIVTLGGTIAGTRETADGIVYVVMFDTDLHSETRSKIHSFLRRIMQYEVDNIH